MKCVNSSCQIASYWMSNCEKFASQNLNQRLLNFSFCISSLREGNVNLHLLDGKRSRRGGANNWRFALVISCQFLLTKDLFLTKNFLLWLEKILDFITKKQALYSIPFGNVYTILNTLPWGGRKLRIYTPVLFSDWISKLQSWIRTCQDCPSCCSFLTDEYKTRLLPCSNSELEPEQPQLHLLPPGLKILIRSSV